MDEVSEKKSLSEMDFQNFLWQFNQDNCSSWSAETRFLASKAKQWHDVVQSLRWPTLPEQTRQEFAAFRLVEIEKARQKLAEQDVELEQEARKLTVEKELV